MGMKVFLVFFICLILSLPIGVAIGIASFLPGWVVPGFPADVQYVIRGMLGGLDVTPILAVPLFILSGAIMAKGGLSEKLFNVFAYFFGNKTAGIPIAVIITCMFYGAISGSGIATTAAVGGMTLPLMIALGYDKVFSGALVATAGGLGVIIPPSIPFIIYALATGTSVGALFIAGIIPGIIIALSLMIYAYVYAKRKGEDREKIMANYNALRAKGFRRLFMDSFWALLTPIIILGGIYSGIVTPTEAAAISVFYSLIVCVFIYKSLPIKNIIPILRETVKSLAPLIFLLAFAVVFGRILTFLRVPDSLGHFLASMFPGKFSLLAAVLVALLIMGMFMDVGPALMILAPILMPVILQMGVDPVHFGIIMTMCLAIGFVTPPFGVNLFVAAPLIQTPVGELGKKALPFVGAFLAALLLVTYIPWLSLLLIS